MTLQPVKAPSLGDVSSATVIGFSGTTLERQPGAPIRPYLILTKEPVSISSQLGTLPLEPVLDLWTAVLLVGFALARVNAAGTAWVLALGGRVLDVRGGAPPIGLPGFLHSREPTVIEGLRFLPVTQFHRAERRVEAGVLVQGVESTRSDAPVLTVWLSSGIEWLLRVACYGCLAQGFREVNLSITDGIIFLGFVAFGAVTPRPGMSGGGARGPGRGPDRAIRHGPRGSHSVGSRCPVNDICSCSCGGADAGWQGVIQMAP